MLCKHLTYTAEKLKASSPEKVKVTLAKDANMAIAYPPMLVYNVFLIKNVFSGIWKLARVGPT